MSDLRRYVEENAAYFVTAVTAERKSIFKDPKLCRILLVTIEYYKTIFDYAVLGYCLMPDHLHLILRPSSRFDLSFIMKMVKGSFTRKINKLNETKGSLWQRRYYDELIRGENQLTSQLDYLHQNPVVAGLVLEPHEYVFSSFRQYNGLHSDSILEIDRMDQ